MSGYRPFAIGLGTLAVDLLLLVVVTSLLRNHLPLRLWKAVHLTSYLLWPLAFVHGITAGTDLGGGWLLVAGPRLRRRRGLVLGRRPRRPARAPRRRPSARAAALTATSDAFSTGTPVGVFRNG